MLDGCTIASSYGSITTRPASISARMSLSERSTPRGYARRADGPQSCRATRLTSACYRRPLPLLETDRHDTAQPGTAWTPHQPAGAETLGLLHRERSGTED